MPRLKFSELLAQGLRESRRLVATINKSGPKEECLPTALHTAYMTVRSRLAIDEAALRHGKSYGGRSDAEAEAHFAARFVNSAARCRRVVLDPSGVFSHAATIVALLLSRGRVRILDIPCGCGEASFAILATIAQLRIDNTVPTMPLDVEIVAADHSPRSLALFDEMNSELTELFDRASMRVAVSGIEWTAGDITTASMVSKRWSATTPECDYIMVISSFVHHGSKADTFDSVMSEFPRAVVDARHARTEANVAVLHIEPEAMHASAKFIDSVQKQFEKNLATKWSITTDSARETFTIRETLPDGTSNVFSSGVVAGSMEIMP